MQRSILVVNGPNLNLLGSREVQTYGTMTLAEIDDAVIARGHELGLLVSSRQSNDEGEIVTWIQQARDGFAAIIINAGAYSHSSIAILDALRAYPGLVIEVHLSNIHARESFRHYSYISARADGVIVGLGPIGYRLALEALALTWGDQDSGAAA